MLFRRFGRHIAEHDWFAVLVDLGVLVLGIFLGLQVTNWNDERREDRELGQYLASLATEFSNSASILDDHIAWQEEIMAGLRLTLAVLDGYEPTPEEQSAIHRALRESGWPPPFPAKREVLFEMQNTGLLQRIPPGDLKSVLMEVLALERVSDDFFERDLSRLTAAPFSPAIVRYGLSEAGSAREEGLLEVEAVDWELARRDPAFRQRVLESHSVFASVLQNKVFYNAIEREVLRLLADEGFEPGTNWLRLFIDRTSAETPQGDGGSTSE